MTGILTDVHEDDFALDPTGKINIDDIYNEPDPRAYYSTLRRLNYLIPQFAKPIFKRLVAARRAAYGTSGLRLLDLGCSYGVNAALLKCDLELEHLNELYDNSPRMPAKELAARDRAFFQAHTCDWDLAVHGLDVSRNALSYGCDAGLLDGASSCNLEAAPLDRPTAAIARNADIIMSTGCVGYVGEKTLNALIEAGSGTGPRPWMGHFVLRMFPFDGIAAALSRHGYVTEKAAGVTFFQRRFASPAEQDSVLARLDELGIDPAGKEADGWYHAEFYLSRPANGGGPRIGDIVPA